MRQPPINTLSERAVTIARIRGIWRAAKLMVVLGGVLLIFVLSWSPWLALALGATVAVPLLIYQVVIRPPLFARYWRYELNDHEIYLQGGIFTITRVLIPLGRVQNVDTAQGPIERMFGVSTVTLSTAGGASAIPLLEDAVASDLREKIDQRVRAMRGPVAR